MEYIPDGAWFSGLDSGIFQLGPGSYQWGQNISNRGGIIGTRQGFAQIIGRDLDDTLREAPRGICLFSPTKYGVDPYIVVAIGNKVFKLAYPYNGQLQQIPEINFPSTTRYIHFEVCVQAQKTDADGNVVDIEPRFVLMMIDGVYNPAYWFFEGSTSKSGHTNPLATPQDTIPWNTPKGSYMKWAGDRLWIADGNKLKASDLLNPLQFEEQKVEASGGFFFLPGTVTGMGVTHDYKSLIVGTDQTTSAFQVGIEDRTAWNQTQDFQRVLFPGIGIVSHRSFVNQYGMSWWMSHDGVVALDSSLQAYQTSRMQVKDHNMSRSKEAVSWANGGGCAGSFGNWLFFSVPSGSKYNVHTWVIDQAVQQNINTIAPPAWCSNWTGIRPEQWVTGTINGVQRCFCLSYDLVPTGHRANVWEAFIGQRIDVPRDGPARPDRQLAKDIGCAFETRFLSLGPGQYMRFRYAELDLAEISGNVNLQVYYCGRRTSYKKILDKKLTAQVTDTTEIVFDPDDLINVYVPQYRTVRSVTDSHDTDDADTGIQTPYIRQIDREFSLLITWTGQMSITGLRLCVDPLSDYQEGVCEDNETTVRHITAEGTGEITSDPAPRVNVFLPGALQSKYMSPLKPRWVEFPSYDAAVPNGVFFVAEPQFSPEAGAYPLNEYAPWLAVTLTTETAGATIVYTTDGTDPTLHPLHGTIYTVPVHVSLGMNLKARGFRDGMINSAIASGTYTQAMVSIPVLDPIAGAYPPGDYPKDVTITCDTTGATIHYVISDSPSAIVTSSSPTYSAPVSVQANKYLFAKAFKAQYLDSSQIGGQFTTQQQAQTPLFTPPGGEYPEGDYPKTIAIHTDTIGAHLRWTKNDPDVENGTLVISQDTSVSVDQNDELRAIAQSVGYLDSETRLGIYTTPGSGTVEEPELHPDGGEFEAGSIRVVFNCATPDADMRYKIGLANDPPDDPTPTSGTLIHDGEDITLSIGHKIIKVIAYKSGMTDSAIHVAQFDHVHGGGG